MVEEKIDFKYVEELLREYADAETLMLLRARLLRNKYGMHLDRRVSVDDIGIIINSSVGFESKFEISLNLIEKAYRKTLNEAELERLCAEWMEYRVPAKILWKKLGVSLEEARAWRYALEIPEDHLKQIAKKLGVQVKQIDGAEHFNQYNR